MAPMTTDDDDHLSRYSSTNNNISDNQSNCYNNQSYNNSFKSNIFKQDGGLNVGNLANNQLNSAVNNHHKETKGSPKSKLLDSNRKSIVSYGTTKASNDFAKFEGDNNGSNNDDNNSGDDNESGNTSHVCVADIIGSFGWFQFLVLIFSGLREGLVGYDALIMSIILQPESRFLCADNLNDIKHNHFGTNSTTARSVALPMHANLANFSALFPGRFNSDREFNETAQCYRSLDGGNNLLVDPVTNKPVRCTSWLFSNETIESTGPSLVAEWSLVCQYHWLVAFIESAYFFGLVTGNLVWGYYADKIGRRPAYLAAHTIALIFSSLAVVAPTISTFAICRFLSAFGSIGYNIIYSIQVELIGVKHRSFSTIMNHLGWGLGVICVPLVDHLFEDYRPIIAVAPVFALIMFPWAFWMPESPRWLMANDRYQDARRELLRAAKFNGKAITSRLEKKISTLEHKIRNDKLRSNCPDIIAKDKCQSDEKINHSPGFMSNNDGKLKKCARVRSYGLILDNRIMLRDTMILSYLAFVGHLFYYVQTINFAYVKNLSTTANFITSGAGEWVSVIVGAVLLKLFSRKTCISLFLLLMTCSFTFQSFIDSELMPGLDTKIVITANNGIGTLASLLLVFITLIVNQEVYPTVVRQTGTSITNTLGESGSTLAPLVIQFSRLIGSWRANVIYSIFCLFGILASQFVTKTDDIDLPDT